MVRSSSTSSNGACTGGPVTHLGRPLGRSVVLAAFVVRLSLLRCFLRRHRSAGNLEYIGADLGGQVAEVVAVAGRVGDELLEVLVTRFSTSVLSVPLGNDQSFAAGMNDSLVAQSSTPAPTVAYSMNFSACSPMGRASGMP